MHLSQLATRKIQFFVKESFSAKHLYFLNSFSLCIPFQVIGLLIFAGVVRMGLNILFEKYLLLTQHSNTLGKKNFTLHDLVKIRCSRIEIRVNQMPTKMPAQMFALSKYSETYNLMLYSR